MELYRIPLYLIFGILPSLIWLFYYLKKDLHPEPKRMILKIFIYGALATIPVFFIQINLSQLLSQIRASLFFVDYPIVIELLKWFLVIAFTEEIFKYLVVKLAVFRSRELDEPVDIMIYMIVAALGFAAVENILYLLVPSNTVSFLQTTIAISFVRFIGATFLHTLCSALIGYFLAKSCSRRKNRLRVALLGIALATLLHGLYNFSIITLDTPLNFEIPMTIIITLAVFVILAFNNVKKMKSICKL